MPSWITGLLKPVTDLAGGVIAKRAEARAAMEAAGFDARLAGWIDDAIIVTFLVPLWLGMASVFGWVDVGRVREMVEVFNLLLDSKGDYGLLLQICLFVGLGVGVTRKLTDKAVKRKMDRMDG